MRKKHSLILLGIALLTPAIPVAHAQRSAEAMLKRFDKNNDGKLEKSELPRQLQARFATIDTNKDGSLSLEELKKAVTRRPGGGRPGEINTPPARGERHRDLLKVGDVAPDFTLPSLDGKSKVKLSSFRGKKPVVLIFGSYT